MGQMKELGLLDCEDRPSIEENFKRMKEGTGGDLLETSVETLFSVENAEFGNSESITPYAHVINNVDLIFASNECCVIWDDAKHECTIDSPDSGVYILGNLTNDPSGLPFIIMYFSDAKQIQIYDSEAMMAGATENTYHDVSITQTKTQLKPSLLPELSHVILKSTTEGSTKKFKVTVDDTGALTTVEV